MKQGDEDLTMINGTQRVVRGRPDFVPFGIGEQVRIPQPARQKHIVVNRPRQTKRLRRVWLTTSSLAGTRFRVALFMLRDSEAESLGNLAERCCDTLAICQLFRRETSRFSIQSPEGRAASFLGGPFAQRVLEHGVQVQ